MQDSAEETPSVKILKNLNTKLDPEVRLEATLSVLALARTENYKLDTEIKIKSFDDLKITEDPTSSQVVELFASAKNNDALYYCYRRGNSTWW